MARGRKVNGGNENIIVGEYLGGNGRDQGKSADGIIIGCGEDLRNQ